MNSCRTLRTCRWPSRPLVAHTLGLVLGLGLTVSASANGDAKHGKVLAQTCTGCHGVKTYDNVYPTYHVPKIGGQSADYIVAALSAYRSGARKHETMHANAASLSDQDMADLAAYISSFAPSETK